MKGIIMAGGAGTRLHPITKAVSKQLLPIHDKPMIYYPLSVLMLARIKEIMIISTPKDIGSYKDLLGDGSEIGLKICYMVQKEPRGIAESFILAEDFIGDDSVSLILGDNIFYGYDFSKILQEQKRGGQKGATIFGYKVSDPTRFGIVEFDKNQKALSLEEKPKKPKSNYAVIGLYFYDRSVVDIAKSISPSARGELEITDVNKVYLKKNKLSVNLLDKGFAWLDTGTHKSLLDASHFISTIENRQGIKIGCLEEIAYNNHWISKRKLKTITDKMSDTDYKDYLLKIIKN